MSAEVVGQHSPSCAKVLLEMDKFMFHKSQVKAEFAIKQRELELRQKTFELRQEEVKEMKKDKKAKKTQDEFIRVNNFGSIDV
jgi:isoaspartyl peptidase/L-asparaginase-like protein (Ntn-hydrolase superfamily)